MLAHLLAALQQHSVYVPVRDGTRIAVDVYLPDGHVAGARHPALLELTRYGRAREDARTGAPVPSIDALDRHFLAHDYAVVKIDVRGAGASFGSRTSEYGREEVRDGRDLVAWVVAQEWCDGNVGAYGTSYSGTTAELLAAAGHPAVKAVVIGWSDFDGYRSPIWPYGIYAESL
ncbi:MAG: CocE/NonD family hydrolase, partial [Planctomycetota bacterium]